MQYYGVYMEASDAMGRLVSDVRTYYLSDNKDVSLLKNILLSGGGLNDRIGESGQINI